jgi:hypothetical protein
MLTTLDLGEFTGDLSRNDMREKVGWNTFVRLKLNFLRSTLNFVMSRIILYVTYGTIICDDLHLLLYKIV